MLLFLSLFLVILLHLFFLWRKGLLGWFILRFSLGHFPRLAFLSSMLDCRLLLRDWLLVLPFFVHTGEEVHLLLLGYFCWLYSEFVCNIPVLLWSFFYILRDRCYHHMGYFPLKVGKRHAFNLSAILFTHKNVFVLRWLIWGGGLHSDVSMATVLDQSTPCVFKVEIMRSRVPVFGWLRPLKAHRHIPQVFRVVKNELISLLKLIFLFLRLRL